MSHPSVGSRPYRRALLAGLLLLFPAGAAAQAHLTVQGVVRDSATGSPLSGVYVAAAQHAGLTDAAGHFSVMVHDAAEVLHFRRQGYLARQLSAGGLAGEVRMSPQPLLMDQVVVRGEQASEVAVGTALTVARVERGDIQATGATSLAEALAGMEGVSVSRPGAWGGKALLRGIGGERLAVLIDGNRVNRACTFGMDQGLATIDPSTVERVEVLSGPGSTLYGSGNIGGVINVVTRRAPRDRPLSGEVRVGGSTGVPGANLGASLWLERARWSVSTTLDGARYGDYRSGAGTVDGSGYGQVTGGLKLGFSPSAAHRLLAQAQAYEGRDIGWPTMPGSEMSIPEESRRSASLDYGWQIGRGTVDALSARGYVQRLDHHMTMRMQTAGAAPMTSLTDAVSHSTTTGGRIQLRLLPSARVHIDAGAEATEWAAEATRWMESAGGAMSMGAPQRLEFHTWPDVRILDVGAFGQGELWLNDRVALTAGARADRIARRARDRAASEEWVGTGNAGLRADLGRGFSTRAGMGLGYRVPDPTELFGLAARPDGFVYRGNPELGTETNRNLEASLGYDARTFGASLTIFRNDLDDLISPVLVPGEMVSGRRVRTYQNLARARLEGATSSTHWQPHPMVELHGTASYTRGEDRSTGAPLWELPPLEGSLALRLMPGRAIRWAEVEGRAAAAQTRVSTAAGELPSAGYGIVNLRAGLALLGSDLVAGVDNLLDKHYRNHIDPRALFQPGRNVYVKVTRAF